MGDHIYYQCANGRIARRDYKSVADLKNALRTEINPDNQEEIQAALDKRMEASSRGQRTSARGWDWMNKHLESVKERFHVNDIVELVFDLPKGEFSAADQRLLTSAKLVQITLDQQKELKAQFEAQEQTDKEIELAKIAAAKQAGTWKPRRRRSGRA